MHERSDAELTGRTAEHSHHLGEADRSREITCRKAVCRQIDGADEGEGSAGTLQQTADIGHLG